ncbi:hypothetical protein [Vibrio tarriae]|uniref:hypothetical protein n=1 Tax=Vibrio tarriae TaxID=2014742 RepID=UPI000DE4BE35|nr:hypothetical protein [Vibrio tarriae]RBM33402.1 hypothetical protein DLR63_18660 [Vibrio tarriae]
MELDKFVTKTLLMISKGVYDAQNSSSEYGVKVNELPNASFSRNAPLSQNGTFMQNVTFNVAITTEDVSEGDAKISVLGLSLGKNGSSTDVYSSRIKFTIPLSFPRASLDKQ